VFRINLVFLTEVVKTNCEAAYGCYFEVVRMAIYQKKKIRQVFTHPKYRSGGKKIGKEGGYFSNGETPVSLGLPGV
jgi:hypothetical protein